MKKVLLLIAMLVCMAIATSGFAVQPADDVDTIALWHMDAWSFYGVGLVWDDISAGYRTFNLLWLGVATDPCRPTVVVHDVTDGNAISFSGAQQAYATGLWKSYTGFGVDMEFKANSVTGTQTLIEATNTWSVSLNGSDVVLTIYTSGATRTLTVTGGAILSTWQHVVASCDAAGNASLQVDAGTPVTSSGLAVKLQTADICLGNTKGSSTKWFTGYIDEVKVTAPGWEASRALSDAAGTWGLWHMDAVTDSNVLDDDSVMTTRNNDIRLGDFDFAYPTASKPTLVSPGVTGSGNALHFDGIQQEAATKILWPANFNKFNIDFWFKAEVSDANTRTIMQAGSVWVIGTSNLNGGNADLGITMYTGGDPRLISAADAVTYNIWHHLILDMSESGHLVITLDGTALSTTDGLPALQASTFVSFGNKQGVYGRWFKGSIDEVKITGSNVYIPHAPTAPAKDGPLTKALWHFDSINASFNFPDDDANHTTRNADLGRYAVGAKLNDNSSYPSCVDPVAAGIGYPSGNSAFGNCSYFDAISGANCQVVNTLLPPLDMNDFAVEGWLYLPADFKLNQGIFSQAAHTYYWFDRWGQVALNAIETATTATDANSKVQFSVTAFDKAGAAKYVTYTFPVTGSPTPYQWNHVKFTCLGNACTLYLNGVSAATATLTNSTGGKGLGLNPSKTTTRIGSRYNPQQYFYGYVDDVMISTTTLKCGDTGYNAVDFNKDCMVNFKDVQALAAEWLSTNAYTGNSGSSNYPSLVEQKWADTGNYNVPKTTVVPTIDGTFTNTEWADARCIELIAPTLVTAPNHGSYRGSPAPAATDYRCFFYAKWDNTYLYMAGVVDDNDVNPSTTTYDEPQLFFNFKNDPAHVTWITDIFCINFSQNSILTSNGGPALTNSSMARINDVPGHRYVFEAKFKWSDLELPLGSGYVPALGDKHGMGFFCQDHNLSGTRVHQMLDFPGDVLNAATNYNTMTLVAAGRLDCHEKLQSLKDLNADCNVNFKDFASFAQQWLNCTDMSGANCH